MSRERAIARSIIRAIVDGDKQGPQSVLSKLMSIIVAFFAIYQLSLKRFRNDLYETLRRRWAVDETAYEESFRDEDQLQPIGDMGYSGSVSHTHKSLETVVDDIADLLLHHG